ncbi:MULTISPECIES: hypothetical protein [Burkholderia]|nr:MULTISPECIES: hypothetical protein [Burkholderia]MDN7789385.1 hypothetical protein [Burkholderia contaminans]
MNSGTNLVIVIRSVSAVAASGADTWPPDSVRGLKGAAEFVRVKK